jgi:hypothetical protein
VDDLPGAGRLEITPPFPFSRPNETQGPLLRGGCRREGAASLTLFLDSMHAHITISAGKLAELPRNTHMHRIKLISSRYSITH